MIFTRMYIRSMINKLINLITKTFMKGDFKMSTPTTIQIDNVEYVRKDSITKINVEHREEGHWKIGKRYAFRTVTMIDHGTLVDVTDKEFWITDAAWIADSGRWSDFVNGKIQPSEVEPFPKGKLIPIGRGALIDACDLDDTFSKQV
jgi:hypothetical protein